MPSSSPPQSGASGMPSRVYLTLAVNNVVYTVNALRPTRRNRLVFGWGFFASWITIELAWLHLIWQVLATLIFGRLGAFKRTSGKAALALSIASWAGLAVLIKDSLGARREIKDALGEVLDQPVPRHRLPITVTRNIQYHMVRSERRRSMFRRNGQSIERVKHLHLDVYKPVEPPEPGTRRPAVVQIHGGGWMIGDKREQGLPLLKLLASQGWVGFNVNYRLSPEVALPEMVTDLKRAIVWIRENAAEYGVDPDFIAVTGGSAGGHLTALVALTANDAEYQQGFEGSDTTVQAAVPFYGVYDFTNRNGYWFPEAVERFIEPWILKQKLEENPEAFAKVSPMDRVRADAPPFLIIHGDRDTLTPVEDARDFARRLECVSERPVHYLELHGAQHAFDLFSSIRCNAVIGAVDQFLTRTYEAHVRATAEVDALHLGEAGTGASIRPHVHGVEPVLDQDLTASPTG